MSSTLEKFLLGLGDRRDMRTRTEELEVAGLRITFERSGEGPLLVLLHGGLSDSREWRRQIDVLTPVR